MPLLASTGDEAVMVMLSEYTTAIRAAMDMEFPPDEVFANLSNGLANGNGLPIGTAAEATRVILTAAKALLDPSDPATRYIERVLAP
jgi:hypothetical protein